MLLLQIHFLNVTIAAAAEMASCCILGGWNRAANENRVPLLCLQRIRLTLGGQSVPPPLVTRAASAHLSPGELGWFLSAREHLGKQQSRADLSQPLPPWPQARIGRTPGNPTSTEHWPRLWRTFPVPFGLTCRIPFSAGAGNTPSPEAEATGWAREVQAGGPGSSRGLNLGPRL